MSCPGFPDSSIEPRRQPLQAARALRSAGMKRRQQAGRYQARNVHLFPSSCALRQVHTSPAGDHGSLCTTRTLVQRRGRRLFSRQITDDLIGWTDALQSSAFIGLILLLGFADGIVEALVR